MGEFINSKQVQFNQSFVSCGLKEMHHLPKQSPLNTLFALATNLYHKANPRPTAFVLFSDIIESEGKSRGQLLAEEIKKSGFCGELIETKSEVNPRTGNTIKIYLLHLNHESFRKWYQEELANRIEE